MVKKRSSTKKAHESPVAKNPAIGYQVQAMIAAFKASPHVFLDQLQFLRQTLDRQLTAFFEYDPAERHKTWDKYMAHNIWWSCEDFDVSSFVSPASDTYEAWDVLRHSNDKIAGFDGASLLSLIQLFRGTRPFVPTSGRPEFTDFPSLFVRFESSVDQLQSRYNFDETQLEGLHAEQVFAVPEYVKPDPPALPFGLQSCDVPQTLKRAGYQKLATIKNDQYWNLMEALMAASPNAIPESKLNYLFQHGGRDNARRRLNSIIEDLGLVCSKWTLQDIKVRPTDFDGLTVRH